MPTFMCIFICEQTNKITDSLGSLNGLNSVMLIECTGVQIHNHFIAPINNISQFSYARCFLKCRTVQLLSVNNMHIVFSVTV